MRLVYTLVTPPGATSLHAYKPTISPQLEQGSHLLHPGRTFSLVWSCALVEVCMTLLDLDFSPFSIYHISLVVSVDFATWNIGLAN